MSDFVSMSDIPINSAAAAASLSMADVKYAGVKLHDTSKVSIGNIVWSSLVGIVAILGVASALFSMWIEASLITCVAFAFPLVTGPCILVQRKRLQWMPTFREESNQLRRLVNALATHRLQLAIEVSRMERQITRMKDVEDRFQQVVRREGKSVQQYRQLIRENAEIQAEIKKAQAAMDLLDLFSVIMMTDRNEDNLVTPSEAEEFMLRIRAFAGRRGKILNEDMILEAFKRSMKNPANAHGTASMFNIVQSAMSDEIVDNTSGNAEANLSEQPTETVLKEKVGDDEFVNLQKVPRVTPTGLVVSESREEEGNLAHPIKVEDLRNAYTNDALLDTKGSLARDKTKSVIPEEDNVDIVSMILQSVSGGLGSN